MLLNKQLFRLRDWDSIVAAEKQHACCFLRSDPFCKCEIHSQHTRALSPTFPFFLSEVKDLKRARGGLQGQSLFLLGTCFLLGAGCLQKTLWGKVGGGSHFSFCKETAGLNFFPLLSRAAFLTSPWRGGFVQRSQQHEESTFYYYDSLCVLLLWYSWICWLAERREILRSKLGLKPARATVWRTLF